jgi:hypothetical protein
MNFLRILTLVVLTFTFSCKSGKDSTEASKKETEVHPREEAKTNTPNEMKTNNEKLPNQTIIGGQQNTSTSTGSKPR